MGAAVRNPKEADATDGEGIFYIQDHAMVDLGVDARAPGGNSTATMISVLPTRPPP